MKESNIECNHCRNMYDSRSYCNVCAGAYKRKESDNIYGNKKSPTFSKKYFYFQNNFKRKNQEMGSSHSNRRHHFQCHHCFRWNVLGALCPCRHSSANFHSNVIFEDNHHRHHYHYRHHHGHNFRHYHHHHDC